jgi:non-ribosomal peptide synthetase component E (peptide arylation enzyme)
MNIYDTLVKSAVEYHEKNAVRSAEQCYTYNSMLEYSRQLAGHLLNLGLSQNANIVTVNDDMSYVITAVKQYVNQKYFDRSLQGRGTFERY